MPMYRGNDVKALQSQLERYIHDVENLALGASWGMLNCYYDGIRDRDQLAAAVRETGNLLIERCKAIRDSAPVVRGNTISIHNRDHIPPNTPSREDEIFVGMCLRQLREHGFVRAADADTYEKITAAYPQITPRRVRGAEARRYIEMRNGDPVTKALQKRLKRGSVFK